MNDENLISLADRTTSEQRAIAQKGGIVSGEVRRKKKLLAEVVSDIMNQRVSDEPNALTRQEALSVKVLTKVYNDKEGKADIDDLLKLQKLMGEEKINLDIDHKVMPSFNVLRK